MKVETQTQSLATHKQILKFSEPSETVLKMSEIEVRTVKYKLPGEENLEKKTSGGILSVNDSNDPSYTNLTLPYHVVCRQRYTKAGTEQRLQFLREIRKQETSQSKALSGVRIHRIFLNPTLVPPNPQEIIKLTPKQQFKLEQLLKE